MRRSVMRGLMRHGAGEPPSFAAPISQPCTYAQMNDPRFAFWANELGQPITAHRKLWEWCYIVQVLELRGCLRPGARALGFGVGREPLVGLFTRRGVHVTATDLPPDAAAAGEWIAAAQHSGSERDYFGPDVEFRYVDMNAMPADLAGFDFTWSSCVIEHLGSLEAAGAFLERQMDCLVPGGVAVHTTEFNVSSNTETVTGGSEVLFRRRDLEALAEQLRDSGHEISMTFRLGATREDRFVDVEPYEQRVHLKLRIGRFVSTSFGLAIRKAPAPA